MKLQAQLVSELRRQAQLLQSELEEWSTMTAEDIGGMGIHHSQIAMLKIQLAELIDRQNTALKKLRVDLVPTDFAAIRSDVEYEIAGSQGLASVFRQCLLQHMSRDRYQEPLVISDLVLADCYRPCIEIAQRSWHSLQEYEKRAPPLTLLHARSEAAAIGSESAYSKLGLGIERYTDLKLPVPIVTLPFYATATFWSQCSLYHEVGHILDQDFGLRTPLAQSLERKLQELGTNRQDIGTWRRWIGEIVADAVGIVLGGVGFANAMTRVLFVPEQEATTGQLTDRHPTPYVRIFLLGALLREIHDPSFEAAADEIEEAWRSLYGEARPLIAPYIKGCGTVASIVLRSHLDTLAGNRLLDLNSDLPKEHKLIAGLAAYLRTGGQIPDPRNCRLRWVPAAAQLAVHDVSDDYDDALSAIQERSLAFANCIPHDKHMAPEDVVSAKQETYLRELVRNVQFRTLFEPSAHAEANV